VPELTRDDPQSAELTPLDAADLVGRPGQMNLFAMIGAEPRTDWLGGCLALDDKGFVLTGQDRDGRPLGSPFATALPGVFAVGDVRSGSIKRVASAVGEGSVVVQSIHELLGGG
jgi:thioredoxin reductase (NADPH)